MFGPPHAATSLNLAGRGSGKVRASAEGDYENVQN